MGANKPARTITHNGETRTVDGWAAALGIPAGTIFRRVSKGLPAEQCLTKGNLSPRKTPLIVIDGRIVTTTEAAKITGLTVTCIESRVQRGLTGAAVIDPARRKTPPKNKLSIEINGERKSLTEWALVSGTSLTTLSTRRRSGLTGEALIAAAQDPETGEPVEEWAATVDLPWELDTFAQDVVRAHPEGMEFQKIADLMGVCKQRVQQIEEGAFAKLRKLPGALEAFQAALELDSNRKQRVFPEAIALEAA